MDISWVHSPTQRSNMNASIQDRQLEVIELRQYTLRPNKRDALIDLFDRELVEPQEAVGMTVLGQFRDLDHPDLFLSNCLYLYKTEMFSL